MNQQESKRINVIVNKLVDLNGQLSQEMSALKSENENLSNSVNFLYAGNAATHKENINLIELNIRHIHASIKHYGEELSRNI